MSEDYKALVERLVSGTADFAEAAAAITALMVERDEATQRYADAVMEFMNAGNEAAQEARRAENVRLREALEKIYRGPVIPPPDPGAHGWQAWGRFWHEQLDRLRLIAHAALERAP